jgi:hypothetical protein
MKSDLSAQVGFKLLEEIRLQCRFATLAYESVRSNVQAWDPEKTFFYVHALLSHTANVSRLLWPARAESKARGDWLRSELKVTDESPIKMGNLRNSLEASDEQFEDWVAAMETPSYLDFNIMPQGTTQGYRQDVFQRNLDPDTFKLVFRGTSCDLRQIIDQLHRIDSAAQTWLKTHKPW